MACALQSAIRSSGAFVSHHRVISLRRPVFPFADFLHCPHHRFRFHPPPLRIRSSAQLLLLLLAAVDPAQVLHVARRNVLPCGPCRPSSRGSLLCGMSEGLAVLWWTASSSQTLLGSSPLLSPSPCAVKYSLTAVTINEHWGLMYTDPPVRNNITGRTTGGPFTTCGHPLADHAQAAGFLRASR